jgi:hypothetical protein
MLDDPEDVAPSRCSTFLHYTWKVCSCVFSHVILVSLVVSYCIMGAFTFQSLEKNNEIKVRFFVFFLNFCVFRPEKWLNGGEEDSQTSIECRGSGSVEVYFHSFLRVCPVVLLFRFFPFNFCVSRPEKWLNRGEADSKSPYSAEVQKGWRFISTHSYVCVLWCYSFVSFHLISVFYGQKSG